MEKSRKFKIVLSVLVVVFLFGFATMYMILNASSEESVLGVQSNQESSSNVSMGIPYILSRAPLTITAGELNEYVPRLVDIDTDVSDLSLELVDAPDWLYLEDGIVLGVAPEVPDTFSFVLRVSDGYNSSQEKIYILVEEKDE